MKNKKRILFCMILLTVGLLFGNCKGRTSERRGETSKREIGTSEQKTESEQETETSEQKTGTKRRGGKSEQGDSITPAAMPIARTPKTINVYIENSGSMDGYVYINENTEFKDAVSYLLAKLPYYYDSKNVKLFFINSIIDSISTARADLSNFAKEINMYWTEGTKTRSSSTNLNTIFKDILNRTDNQSVSILFSDCIYSIGRGSVTGLLGYEKNLTMSAFLDKAKQSQINLATTIVKMESKFDGRYYPYTGDNNWFYVLSAGDAQHKDAFKEHENMARKKTGGFNNSKPCVTAKKRPYYICVIGDRETLRDFNNKIEINKLNGYKDKYVLSSEDPAGMYYSVLNMMPEKKGGRFVIDRENSARDYIHGIKDVKLLRNSDTLTLAVAVDFGRIKSQVDENYILNTDNYEVTSKNFTVKEVFAVDKMKMNAGDLNILKDHSPTHVVMLQSTVKKLNDTEVSFTLKKQMPQWVTLGSTENDTDPENLANTTFGLKYWVDGIVEAYREIDKNNEKYNNKNYFEGKITIK